MQYMFALLSLISASILEMGKYFMQNKLTLQYHRRERGEVIGAKGARPDFKQHSSFVMFPKIVLENVLCNNCLITCVSVAAMFIM